MGAVPIPAGAIGRIGMVAQLRRVEPVLIGRLVIVRRPIGPMTALGHNGRPHFAWQAVAPGELIEVDGRACREIVVPDACLRPVSQVDEADVDVLLDRALDADLDAAQAELRELAVKLGIADWSHDTASGAKTTAVGPSHLLEVVPLSVVLPELAFKAMGTELDASWQWSGVHQGCELYIVAQPDLFGRWQLTGRNVTQRQAMWDERVLNGDESRGAIALQILSLWREAFGDAAPVPDLLRPALVYERHREDMRSLKIGLPTLYADGEVLRAIRHWIERRQPEMDNGEPVDGAQLDLSFDQAMLRLSANGESFGCPATGSWVGDCQIALRDFLKMPIQNRRGWRIALEMSADTLSLNGYRVHLQVGNP